MIRHYALQGHETILCKDIMEWARNFEKTNRRVAETTIGDVRISTVFLGLDHSFGQGPPLLFETMVFGGPHDQDWMERCSTWEQAEAMHAEMCKRVNSVAAT